MSFKVIGDKKANTVAVFKKYLFKSNGQYNFI